MARMDVTTFEIRHLMRASAVLTPLLLLAIWAENEAWLRAEIATTSVYIAMERSGLAPLGVVLQGIVISIAFLTLLVSLAVPALFVVSAAKGGRPPNVPEHRSKSPIPPFGPR
jgi:hypothetical protein